MTRVSGDEGAGRRVGSEENGRGLRSDEQEGERTVSSRVEVSEQPGDTEEEEGTNVLALFTPGEEDEGKGVSANEAGASLPESVTSALEEALSGPLPLFDTLTPLRAEESSLFPDEETEQDEGGENQSRDGVSGEASSEEGSWMARLRGKGGRVNSQEFKGG